MERATQTPKTNTETNKQQEIGKESTSICMPLFFFPLPFCQIVPLTGTGRCDFDEKLWK